MNDPQRDAPADAFTPQTIQRWRVALWSMVALMLLAPAVAIRFTREMRWGAEDFLALGALLGAAGLAVEMGVRVTQRRTMVIALVLGVGALFLLVWAELAVGVF